MIGFAGLSHLGLNYSLATAAKGFEVVAYDPDPALAARLRMGYFPIEEPGFRELWTAHRSRLRYTSDPAELSTCTVVFYALDVRTNERNESDLAPLTALIEGTADRLATGAAAVVLSQVRPGYMRAFLAGRAERTKQPLADIAARWYYQVETLIFGAAVQRAMEPERYVVGAAAPANPLPAPYRAWLDAFGCPVLVMRYESAELAKIAINFFLVSTVSTTNTLAEVCEAIGADWGEIAPALRLDQRIGPHAYLKPGLGIAGGNLERDLVTIQGLATEHGTEAGIVAAWQRNSAHAKGWALRTLQREVLAPKPAARIALWGLAYKQDTHSLKNSAAIELLRAIEGTDCHAYDPVARIDPAAFPRVTVHARALDALTGADALVIMTPWRQFADIPPSSIRQRLSGDWVIDPYGVLDAGACRASGLRYARLGCA
jgi:UDPglucose 6-dehydrogenase